MNRFLFVTGPVLICAMLITGCSDKDSATGPGEGNGGIVNPSFAADIQPIFSDRCASSGCHNITATAQLNLSAGEAYENLVRVMSIQSPELDRVKPNDPDNSYLIIKIEGRQTTGSRMPPVESALTDEQIATIRNWIKNGAPNN